MFFNRFAHLLLSYHHFIITPDGKDDEDKDLNLTPQQPETQQNFDKISFLSDQVQSHLPFLARFLETQMFTLFIDQCVDKMSGTGGGGTPITPTPFDVRVSAIRDQSGESHIRTPTYKEASNINTTNEILDNRLQRVELTVTPQKINRSENQQPQNNDCQNKESSDPQPPPSAAEQVGLRSDDTKRDGSGQAGIFPLLEPSKFNVCNAKRRRGKGGAPKLIKGKSNISSIVLLRTKNSFSSYAMHSMTSRFKIDKVNA